MVANTYRVEYGKVTHFLVCLQHAEAAHAAGDTGGFDTFQQHLEGNELGTVASRQAGHDSDDLDDENDDEAALQGALEGYNSEDEVDLYTAFSSDDDDARPEAIDASDGGVTLYQR